MNKFDPPKGELLFRLMFSLGGLALTAFAIAGSGWPIGLVQTELLVIAVVFFVGSALWSAWKLWKRSAGADNLQKIPANGTRADVHDPARTAETLDAKAHPRGSNRTFGD